MTDRDREAGIRWRLRRGMRELDILLEGFYEACYPDLPDPARRAFVALLECEDDDLWAWLTGRDMPARDDLADAVRRIRRHAGL